VDRCFIYFFLITDLVNAGISISGCIKDHFGVFYFTERCDEKDEIRFELVLILNFVIKKKEFAVNEKML
jgi:hypothetical protein